MDDTVDTVAIKKAGLAPAKRGMDRMFGLAAGVAGVFWLLLIAAAVTAPFGLSTAPAVGDLLTAGAAGGSLAAVYLGANAAKWRADSNDHKRLLDSITALHANNTAVHARLSRLERLINHISDEDRNNQWAAYSAGFADATKPERH